MCDLVVLWVGRGGSGGLELLFLASSSLRYTCTGCTPPHRGSRGVVIIAHLGNM